MAGEFDKLLPKQGSSSPSNLDVNNNPFKNLLPKSDTLKFKLSTEGEPSENLSDKDLSEGDAFDSLLPNTKEPDNIDGDTGLWEKVGYATLLGLKDTYRGTKQLFGKDLKNLKAEQEKLYSYMQNPDGSTNYAVAAAYFGGAILDPVGWLLPATKAKTLYKAAKYGFITSGIAGGLGYVDEESILDTRGKQAAASAVGGAFITPLMKGIGKKIKGEKVFTRESLGIPGFQAPSIKVQAETELQKLKLLNEAGKKNRDALARKKIEIQDNEKLNDIPQDKTKLLRGPRSFFLENVVKPYQDKFGKPLLNTLTKGEFGAETGGAAAGAISGFSLGSREDFEESPVMNKFSLAFTGALAGALGLRGLKKLPKTTVIGEKGVEAEDTIEVAETWGDYLGRMFIDGYKLPDNYKALKAEAQGFGASLGARFSDMATKIQQTLTQDEQKILLNMLEGDAIFKVAPKTLENLSKESRNLITEMGQKYVDIGLISPATFEKNKNIYIKRSYFGKLENRPFAEELKNRGATADRITYKQYKEEYSKQKAYVTTSVDRTEGKKTGLFVDVEGKKELLKGHKGWELAESSKGKIQKLSDEFNEKIKVARTSKKKADLVKEKKAALDNLEVDARWEFTKPQRVAMGEIEDTAFALAETGRASSSTLVQYKFYDNLSRQPYVYAAKNSIPQELKETYRQMPKISMSKTDGKQRYGNLAGKYVPKEIYNNLIVVSKQTREGQEGVRKAYRSLNSYWKLSKTAWNPTVHVNNIVTNFVLHDLIDADIKYLLPAFKARMKHNKVNPKTGKVQKSELVQLAQRYGVFDADLISTELQNIKPDAKFPYKIDETGNVFANGITSARNIFTDLVLTKKLGLSKLTEWYKVEDEIFRLSVFQDRIAKGWDIQDAALDARRAFIDYNIDAPAINWMRNTVTPFIAYTYRIIPILAETAIVRPWKYLKYAAIGYGLNEMGGIVSGGDEKAERAVMPERKQGRFLGVPFLPHRNIKIPIPQTGDEQRSFYMDFTRFTPGGDVMDLNGVIPGLPAPLQPSGGLAGEVLFPLVGYDLFRQKKIEGQTGMFKDDIPIRLNAIKEKLVPNIPFLPGSYSSQKLERTRKGIDSPFTPDQTEFVSLAQALGFKIERAELDKLTTSKVFELKRKLKGYEEQINLYRNKFRKGLMNRETATIKIDEVAKQMRDLADKYGVYFEKANYPDPKKPFESIKGLFERQN
tara:strand:+ start:510 stop:4148 length:3639 start_codon:yes stop_codon:yes gene_type:complete